jgi:hypothetical protein
MGLNSTHNERAVEEFKPRNNVSGDKPIPVKNKEIKNTLKTSNFVPHRICGPLRA